MHFLCYFCLNALCSLHLVNDFELDSRLIKKQYLLHLTQCIILTDHQIGFKAVLRSYIYAACPVQELVHGIVEVKKKCQPSIGTVFFPGRDFYT